MKSREKNEFKIKSVDEIKKALNESRSRLLSMQMEKGQATLKDLRSISRLKDDIARMITFINLKKKEVKNNG